MIVRLILSATFAVGLSCGSVLADTQRVTTKSGKSALIAVSGNIDPATCKSTQGISNQFIVLTVPQNGSVVTALQDTPYKSPDGASSCHGKIYLANVLLYKPNRGFKGVDSFSVGQAVSVRDLEMINPVLIEIEVQ